MQTQAIVDNLKKNWIAVVLALALAFVVLIWPVGILIPDGTPADDRGASLFKEGTLLDTDEKHRLTDGINTAVYSEALRKYVLTNSTKLSQKEGSNNAGSGTSNSGTQDNGTKNEKLGNNKTVTPEGFPNTLDELTEFINSCPSVDDEAFNDAWDGSSIETSSNDVCVLPKGSAEAIASLVKQFGMTRVWEAIQNADTSTAFLWKSEGYADQIRVAEQAADKPYTLDFDYYTIDNDGNKDDLDGKMDEDGILYAADYNFK